MNEEVILKPGDRAIYLAAEGVQEVLLMDNKNGMSESLGEHWAVSGISDPQQRLGLVSTERLFPLSPRNIRLVTQINMRRQTAIDCLKDVAHPQSQLSRVEGEVA